MTTASPSPLRLALGVLGWTFGCALAAPFVTLALIVPFYLADKVCGTPGDSGGCEMGFGVMVIMSPLAGATVGFVVGLVRAFRRTQTA
ncbi:MAG: hypothetical protein AB7T86_04835 [Xanthobacteraceae bacterium]|uniref:hypothetical protein n=1 Tax=Pseudolabrys sp. TaxID=1960880 RepID=UPI003D1492BF